MLECNYMVTMIKVKNTHDIGQQLRNYRKHNGLTQQDIADLAGVSRKVVVELEGGKESIQFDIILKILSVTNLSLTLEGVEDVP